MAFRETKHKHKTITYFPMYPFSLWFQYLLRNKVAARGKYLAATEHLLNTYLISPDIPDPPMSLINIQTNSEGRKKLEWERF